MNSSSLISRFRAMGPQPLNVVLQLLADHLYELRTRTGHRLFNAENVKDFLEEAAGEAAKTCGLMELVEVAPSLEVRAEPMPPEPQPRWEKEE